MCAGAKTRVRRFELQAHASLAAQLQRPCSDASRFWLQNLPPPPYTRPPAAQRSHSLSILLQTPLSISHSHHTGLHPSEMLDTDPLPNPARAVHAVAQCAATHAPARRRAAAPPTDRRCPAARPRPAATRGTSPLQPSPASPQPLRAARNACSRFTSLALPTNSGLFSCTCARRCVAFALHQRTEKAKHEVESKALVPTGGLPPPARGAHIKPSLN